MKKKQTTLKLTKLQSDSTTKPHYLGHRERMRQRLAAKSGSLADYEVLEMLLYYVFPRKDTKALAKKLIAHFGNIRSVIFSDKSNLKRIEGAGKACITMFSVMREAFVRLSFDEVKKSTVIASSAQVMDFYKNIFFNMKHEQLRIMFLNSKNLLITEEVFQEGTINQTPIYPRMIIQRAFELGAAAIIMVHNHPSGDPQPSRQDIIMTRALRDVASKLDILLLDHLIIGKNDVFSMKEHSII
ncbi:MAG: DNA repair protein RadC [Alphaproteobacteria bacterium]|nr:DNA repair protein RadC [Alphaproteobacteria bacterium]